MQDTFTEAYSYYQAHQEAIICGHLGEFVVIQGDRIFGYYKTWLEGLNAMAGKLELGTFIVHKCRPIGEPDIQIAGVEIMG